MTKKNKTIKRVLFIIIFIIFLPIFLIEFLIRFLIKRKKFKKWKNEKYDVNKFLEQSEIERIDIMEGYEFEKYLKFLFFYLGYAVELTSEKKDYGADLIIKKDGNVIAVQAKRYSSRVGIKAVQEIVSSAKHYDANQTMVVTNSMFSSEAEQIAKEQQVELVDRNQLISLINEAKMLLGEKTNKFSEIVKDEDSYKYRI